MVCSGAAMISAWAGYLCGAQHAADRTQHAALGSWSTCVGSVQQLCVWCGAACPRTPRVQNNNIPCLRFLGSSGFDACILSVGTLAVRCEASFAGMCVHMSTIIAWLCSHLLEDTEHVVARLVVRHLSDLDHGLQELKKKKKR